METYLNIYIEMLFRLFLLILKKNKYLQNVLIQRSAVKSILALRQKIHFHQAESNALLTIQASQLAHALLQHIFPI